MSIYEYADSIDSNKHITYYDVFKTLLKDIECVVCLESAADLLGYSNGGYRDKIDVYTLKEYNLPYLNCHIVDNLEKIPSEDFNSISVTPIECAVIEMLSNDSCDDQIIFETLANYYYKNNKSFSRIKPPKSLKKKFNYYSEEGKKYYESM